MQKKGSKKQVLEGVIRRDVDPKKRPSLDPFAKKSAAASFGTTRGKAAGISDAAQARSRAVRNAPAINLELDEVADSEKTRKRKHKKARSNRHRFFRRFIAGSATVVLLTGGFLGLNVFRAAHKIFKGSGDSALALQEEVDPTKLKGEGDGRVNILLAGIGGPGHDGPYLTDTLIVASLDPFAKEVSLVSIPRDLWVTTKGFGSSKINSVMPYSRERNGGSIPKGMETLSTVVSDNLGIPIHYFTVVDFTAFKDAINTVGGVEIDVKTKLVDPTVAWENKNNPVIADVGRQKFDGQRALLYARSRKTSLRGDFDRNERQKEVIIALKNKVVSLGTFGNPIKMTQLVNNAGEHVQTDLSIPEMKRLYDVVKDIPADKVMSIGLADPPHELVKTGNIGGASVVIPAAGVGNFEAIKAYIRSTLVDGFIRKENAQIMVLNGTGVAGLAKTRAEDLKSYGYNIGTVGDAGSTQTTTQIIEISKNKAPYTRKYLENRFKVTATSGSIPAGQTGQADFVIILGRDAISQ